MIQKMQDLNLESASSATIARTVTDCITQLHAVLKTYGKPLSPEMFSAWLIALSSVKPTAQEVRIVTGEFLTEGVEMPTPKEFLDRIRWHRNAPLREAEAHARQEEIRAMRRSECERLESIKQRELETFDDLQEMRVRLNDKLKSALKVIPEGFSRRSGLEIDKLESDAEIDQKRQRIMMQIQQSRPEAATPFSEAPEGFDGDREF